MDIERKLQYDQTYMNMAIILSGLSYAKRSKVGCLIVSDDGQIISQGFNGMPSGMDNCCEVVTYDDITQCSTCKREYCEGCNNVKFITRPEVLHAESNAIAKCAKWIASTDNATLYVTLSPCLQCAKQMIQVGIKRVVYYKEYRDLDGVKLLNAAGIKVQKIGSISNDRIALVDVNDEYIKIIDKNK